MKVLEKYADTNIQIASLAPNEVSQNLPVADFAFLLRGNTVTNRVAFPNKFLEYVMAGLKVITTPYVPDIAANVKKYNIGYVIDDLCYQKELSTFIAQNNKYGNDFDVRQQLVDELCFENRLLFFKEFSQNG